MVSVCAHNNDTLSCLAQQQKKECSLNCLSLLAESVSVGVTMRNPLKVPLVMRRVALTWSHSPLPSSTGGGEGAKVEVLEKVVVQPLSEKMVS